MYIVRGKGNSSFFSLALVLPHSYSIDTEEVNSHWVEMEVELFAVWAC